MCSITCGPYFNLFRLANYLVNPIIYSFTIPMFREKFKRVKLCKQSNEYAINFTSWKLNEDSKKNLCVSS